MEISRPKSVLVGVVVAALAMAGAVSSASAVSAGLASAPQPAAAAASSVVDGPACPDVMVIGARGTNETPTADWQTLNAYASDQYQGVGQTVDKVYTQLKTENPGLVFSLEPVVYQTALPSLGTPLLQFVHDIQKYLGDAAAGGANIAEDVLDTDLACPGGHVHYVLVGYSMGAWAIHDALTLLTAQLNEISGVALFGDPKYTPGQPYDAQQNGFAGSATLLPGDNNIPAILQPHTGSWCLPGDGICQTIGVPAATLANELAPCIVGAPPALCAHFQYAVNGDTSEAAAFLSLSLPALTPPNDFQWTTNIPGTTGSDMPLPANVGPALVAYLYSVACPSAGSCVAVGSYMDSSGYLQPLIETQSGRSWEPTEVTLPGNAEADTQAGLTSVACPSATSCVAVGSYNNGSAMLVTGSGTTWTPATAAPLPGDAQSGASSGLVSVICPSATSCVAVGEYNDIPNTGTSSGLILTGPASSGTLWTPTHAPLPANATSLFSGQWPAVACMSSTSCVTTWTYNNSSGTQQGALDTGSGTNWTTSELPLPGDTFTSDPVFTLGGQNGLGQPLACSATTCVAVAHYVDSYDNVQSLLVTGSGTNWTQTETPLPADALPANDYDRIALLNSVACESATTCVATGEYSTLSGTQPLIVTGSGTSWTPATAPVPANAVTPLQMTLDSVTCPTTYWCEIAGSYATTASDGSHTIAGLALSGSGTSWNTTLAPLPGNTYSANTLLNSLTCPSVTACIAVGQYVDSTNWHGLLATGAP